MRQGRFVEVSFYQTLFALYLEFSSCTRLSGKRDSNVHASLVHNGGHVGNTFVDAVLEEPGACFRGVGSPRLGREFLDAEMTAEHPSDHTSSSALQDRAAWPGALRVQWNQMIPPGTKDVHSHHKQQHSPGSNCARRVAAKTCDPVGGCFGRARRNCGRD